MDSTINNNKNILLLYAVLVILQCLWPNVEAGPPTVFRIVYWLCVFVPAIFNKSWMPMAVAMFYTLSCYGYAYGYMPYETYWYFLFAVSALIAGGWGNQQSKDSIFLFFAVYVTIVDFVSSLTIDFTRGLPIAMLSLYVISSLCDDEDGSTIEKMSLGFSVVTIAFSALFFIHYSEYAISYAASDLERSGWVDPNYFGMVLCFGGISALFELYRKQFSRNWFKFIYIAAIVIVIPTLIANASRGAVLAFASAFAIILLKSNVRKTYKIGIITLAAIFVALLFTTSVFDLLIYRMNNDEIGGGSGRMEIWSVKISQFLDNNFFSIIFGLGSESGLKLGVGQALSNLFYTNMGFHNDYIAFLVKYGIIGFFVFVFMLLKPLRQTSRYSANFVYVLGGTMVIALFGMTLEPFSTGGFAYWMFYLYILKLSSNKAYNEGTLDSYNAIS